MGITSGQGSIRYVPNISGDFGRYWARAHSLAVLNSALSFILSQLVAITLFAFKWIRTSLPILQSSKANKWVDPQPICQCPEPLVVQQEDQLIETANDGGLKSVFEQTSLAGFWIKTKADYPEISVKALITLLPFPTTYRWEAGFSAMTATKTKFCNRLDITNTVFHHPQMEPSCCRETSTGLPLIKMNCSLFCALTNAF